MGSLMNTVKAIVIFILIIMINLSALPASVTGDVTDAGNVNKMIRDIRTPIITPGENGALEFQLFNPMMGNSTMGNITLIVSIYLYKTTEQAISTADIQNAPKFVESGSTNAMIQLDTLKANTSEIISLDISTIDDTPHGGYFYQSSYFVSFLLEFNMNNDSYVMASRGHFSDEEWFILINNEADDSGVNITYMNSLGYDGIIPDTSFSVMKYIPHWPYYLLIAIAAFIGAAALSLYIIESDTKHVKLKKGLQKMWGKFYQFRKLAKYRFGRNRGKVHIPPRDKES